MHASETRGRVTIPKLREGSEKVRVFMDDDGTSG